MNAEDGKFYGTGELQVSYGVDHTEGPDGDKNGLAACVYISTEAPAGPVLVKMTKQEWHRLCDLTVIDRDMKAREAFFAERKAWKDLQDAVEAAGEKIRAEIKGVAP